MDGVFMKRFTSMLLCSILLGAFLHLNNWRVLFPVLCLPESKEIAAFADIDTQKNDYEVRFFVYDWLCKLKNSAKFK